MVNVVYLIFSLSALALCIFFYLLKLFFEKQKCSNNRVPTYKKTVQKNGKLKPINLIKLIKTFKTTNYFNSPSNPKVKIKHSSYTNSFFTGFQVILLNENSTVCVPENVYNTFFLNNFLISTKTNFKTNNLIEMKLTVTNLLNKKNQLKIMNKFHFNITEPIIKIFNKNNLAMLEYKNNWLISRFAVNKKSLYQNFKLGKSENYSLNFTNLTLAPKCSVTVTLTNTFSLQQTTTQSVKSFIFKPNVNSYEKYNKTNFGFMFNYKITSNCNIINNLLNQTLPQKIIKCFNKQNAENNLFNYVFAGNVEQLKKYNYKKIITWLNVREEYCLLYKYLLEVVLGVKIFGNVISFSNYSNYLGKVIIEYNNRVIVKYNLANSFYFTYNNIIYKNVNLLNLKHSYLDVKTKH